MWFKNLIFYRFQQPFTTSQEELELLLQKKAFHKCGTQDIQSYGWVSPMGRHGKMLSLVSGDCLLLTAHKEEKILPASVIREAVEEKADAIEQEEDRIVSSREKRALKEDVTMTLLPRAFSRSQNISAYIDTQDQWLVVDAASFKKAEEFTSFLRDTLGSLPVVNLSFKNTPSWYMTQWLIQKNLPQSFELGDECELREPGDDGGKIKANRQELTSAEIMGHLDAGKQVSKLALNWEDSLTYVLCDDLVIRKMKFTDTIATELDNTQAETAEEQLDADFSLMSLTFRNLLSSTVKVLGSIQPLKDHETIKDIAFNTTLSDPKNPVLS
ncbi:Recombination-associated protein RdgC [invertebrate metagenome]|uniref:Recombination-associated protein RdgC n=1 Tax=invertebrate metagenome TaxID=1711999 RepID=A0A2H9T9U9_9ZZZZ